MRRVSVSEPSKLKLLLYGQPGSTKTRTAATAAMDARTAPALHLDIGGTTLSVRDRKDVPDILLIEKLTDLNAVYDYLKAGQPKTHALAKDFGLRTDYKTIIFDGVTDTQRMAFDLLTGNGAKGPGDSLAPVQLQQYGAALAQMTAIARLFYLLPMHVIITALEREDRNEATGQIYYRPFLTGQAAQQVAAYAYTVMRLVHRARVEKRTLQQIADATADTIAVGFVKTSGTAFAKDQAGMGVDYLVDPTVGEMLDLIQANTAVH